MKKRLLKLTIIIFLLFGIIGGSLLYANTIQKKVIIPIEKLPKIVDVSSCSKDDFVTIIYEIGKMANRDIIKSAQYYYVSNNTKHFLGKFDAKIGFIDSSNNVIYELNSYGIEPVGLSTSLLQFPTSIVGLIVDEGKLYETEVLFNLSFNLEKKTIIKWVPSFWD